MPSRQKAGLFSCLKGASPAKPRQTIPRLEPVAKRSGKPHVSDTLKPRLEIEALKLSCAKQSVALEARKAALAAAAKLGQAAVARLRKAEVAAEELVANLEPAPHDTPKEKSQQEQLTQELLRRLPLELTPEPPELAPMEIASVEDLEAKVAIPQELEEKLLLLRAESMMLFVSIRDKQYLNRCLGLEVNTLEQSLASLMELGDNQIIDLDMLRTKNASLLAEHGRLGQECSPDNSSCLSGQVPCEAAQGSVESSSLETSLLRAVAHHQDLSQLEAQLVAARAETNPVKLENQQLVQKSFDLRPVPAELRDPSRTDINSLSDNELGNRTCDDESDTSPLVPSRIVSKAQGAGQKIDTRSQEADTLTSTCRRLDFDYAGDVLPSCLPSCIDTGGQAEESLQEMKQHNGVDRQPSTAILTMPAEVTQPNDQSPLADEGMQTEESLQVMQQHCVINSQVSLESLTLCGDSQHSEMQRTDSEPCQLRQCAEPVRADMMASLNGPTLRDAAHQIVDPFPLCCLPKKDLRNAAQQCENLPCFNSFVASAHGDTATTWEEEQLAAAVACNNSLRLEIEHRKAAAAAACNTTLRLKIAQGKERLSQYLLREQIAQEKLKQQVQNLRESVLARIGGKGPLGQETA
eukprot:TRINITY_DN103648_c0_g1_i1.p1 TRINITY_DN103648_c0_g1~~TRINITY_DN103648_c0_g1_i1.p1  ORF type:complete len:654 (-),score=156.28 TRINITY_DN103648_c0_g1_i1:264-2171(-)